MKYMYMAFREKTKCKQYIFDNQTEMINYFSKKWYEDEVIFYLRFKDRKEFGHGYFKGGRKDIVPLMDIL
jgi:hypothetical protein